MVYELIEPKALEKLQEKTKELCDEGLGQIRKELLHTLQVQNVDEAIAKLGEQVVLEIEKDASLERALEETDSETREELVKTLGKELIASHEIALLEQLLDCIGDILTDYCDNVLENDKFYDDPDDYDPLPAASLLEEYGVKVRQKYRMCSEED